MIFTVTAGHGENDPGAVAGKLTERDLMAELRNLVAARLTEMGHTVRVDGKGLQNLPLVHALTLVPGAACAIELHTNAAVSPEACGVEVVAMPQAKARAQRLASAIAKVLGTRVRGEAGWIDQSQSARGRLGFVRAGGMVVEAFFLSNPAELAKYLERKAQVADAVAAALHGLGA